MSEATVVDGLTTALRVAGLHMVGPLGAGAGGPRWGASDESGTRWVVTVLSVRSTVHRSHLTERVARLSQLEHEHVATVGPVLPLPGARLAVLHREVTGTDLATVCAGRGPWDIGEVVTVIVPLAGALATLHDAGLSHGDVAPGNVILTPQGRAVLVDVIGSDDAREAGTPGFAAPERVSEVSPAVDVYSLGRLGLALLGLERTERTERPERVEVPSTRELLAAALLDAVQDAVDRRPTASELATRVYAVCPPVPVNQPDPAVLATLTLRRLGDLAAADRTRRASAGTRGSRGTQGEPGTRGRHRRSHGRRGVVLACAVGAVLAVCGATVAATVAAEPGPTTTLSSASSLGTGGVPSSRAPAQSTGLASAVPAAVRLTWARATALASGDRVALARVTVVGSPAARADLRQVDHIRSRALAGTTPGAAPSSSPRNQAVGVHMRVEEVRLLGRTATGSPLGGCRDCARVLVVAEVLATNTTAGSDASDPAPPLPADPAAAESGSGAIAVVLVMQRTAAGWRVSEVEPYAR